MPTGFADGTDDAGSGTTYTAGDGISISNNTISTALASDDGDAPNVGSNLVHWNRLTGVPAGFADGNDDAPLADGSVTTAKLANDAVTTLKLAAAAVTAAKLAQMGASTDQVLTWSGTAWEPRTPTIASETDPTWSGSATTSSDISRTGSVLIGSGSFTGALLDIFGGNVVVRSGTVEITPASDGQRPLRLRSANGVENVILDVRDNQNGNFFEIGGSDFIDLLAGGGVNVRNKTNTAYTGITASAFNVASSRELKRNIRYLGARDIQHWTRLVLKARPATYNYKWEGGSSTPRLGFIAEDMPSELLGVDSASVNYSAITAGTVAALQGLHSQMEEQRLRYESLIAQYDRLLAEHETAIARLEHRIRLLEASTGSQR